MHAHKHTERERDMWGCGGRRGGEKEREKVEERRGGVGWGENKGVVIVFTHEVVKSHIYSKPLPPSLLPKSQLPSFELKYVLQTPESPFPLSPLSLNLSSPLSPNSLSNLSFPLPSPHYLSSLCFASTLPPPLSQFN